MLGADLMIGTNDRPLKQRPDAFYGVRVDIATYPLHLTMADRLMRRVAIRNAHIPGVFVRNHPLGIRFRRLFDELMKHDPRRALCAMLHADSDGATALDGPEHHGLVVITER